MTTKCLTNDSKCTASQFRKLVILCRHNQAAERSITALQVVYEQIFGTDESVGMVSSKRTQKSVGFDEGVLRQKMYRA